MSDDKTPPSQEWFAKAFVSRAEYDRLRAALDEAEAALRPFARIADIDSCAGPSESVIVNVARCRDARATLARIAALRTP
jgi:hypothetical protein